MCKQRPKLNAWGWYPQGGGEVELQVSGGSQLGGIDLLERGDLVQVRGLAVVTELPSDIPQRMASRAENLLHEKAKGRPIRLVRSRISAKAVRLLFKELINSLLE